MGTDVESLEELRLSVGRLQRHNRWLALFSALVGLGLVLSVISPVSIVRSRRYALHDDRDRQRGMWRVRNNAPAMILQDDRGVWRAVITIAAEGPRLTFNSPLGEPLITLSTPGPQAFFAMHDQQGRPRLQMTVSDDGGRLVFLDADGQTMAAFSEPPH